MLQEETSRLLPVWSGETTYNETGMFIGRKDRFALLFKPERILSVTSYDRQRTYREGEDFIVTEDGCIALTETSAIPYITEAEYYADDPESLLTTLYRGREVRTYWGEGDTMTKWQICVTYTHAPAADCFVPPCYAERFRSVLDKLAEGRDVSVLFFGDSITAGATASYYSGVTPRMPSWPALACEYLAKRFGYTLHYLQTELESVCRVPTEDSVYGKRGTLTYINTAVGGWKSDHAVEHFESRVARWLKEYGCDLFVIGFGMNDGKKTAERLLENLRVVIDRALALAPSLSVLAIATMLPNPLATQKWYGNQETFEEAMLAMAQAYVEDGISCAVVPMTSMSRWVLSRKRFCDCSGNNINHPNDFMIRLYAQTLLQALVGLEEKHAEVK